MSCENKDMSEGRVQIDECIDEFIKDTEECPDEEWYFTLYKALGLKLCNILDAYCSNELVQYANVCISALFSPVIATH